MSKGKKFSDFGLLPADFLAPGRSAAYQRRVDSAGKCLASAKDALRDFRRGCHIFGLSKGQFSAIDLVSAALEHTGPGSLSCWSWVVAPYEIEAFSAFFNDGRVLSLKVILDWSASERNAPLILDLQRKFGLDSVRISKNHAKLFSISTADGWKVVARGSANLNKNPRFENFDISDDERVFQVVRDVEDELWRRGRPLPVSELRHRDAVALLDAPEVAAGSAAWAEGIGKKEWW